MKTYKIILLFVLFSFLLGCSSNKEKMQYPTLKQPVTLAISSDLHFQKDNLEGQTSIVGQMLYNNEIIDAMLADMKQNKPNAIILNGDLVNQGDRKNHELLIKKLLAVEKTTPVFVVPGNHDFTQITIDEYRQLYHELGYDQAFSQDSHSLSYAVKLKDDVWLVFLDTNDHEDSYATQSHLTTNTVSWLEDIFQQAKQSNAKLLTFSHHNLINHISSNSDTTTSPVDIPTLFLKNDVSVHFSGHRHTQHIASVVKGKQSFTEIVIGMPISYPNTYGIIEVNQDRSVHFLSNTIPVTQWAKSQQPNNPDLLNFETYSYHEALRSLENTADLTLKDLNLTEEQRQVMKQFFIEVSFAYKDGILFDQMEVLRQNEAYTLWQQKAKGTVYQKWMAFLLNETQTNFNTFSK